ncbi:hypothetical protein KKI24_29000 [bacterium]|nr:hypothetical protein [bacterium]
MTLSRLDRANFGGPLVQALLYRAMKNPGDDWIEYTIDPNEEYDLYKVSYNVWGTVDCWWVIAVVAGLDNPMDRLPAGTVLMLPPLPLIREWMMKPGKTIQ